MQIQLPQFFEDSDEGFVTFDLSFLQRVGRVNLVAGSAATVEFEVNVGKAGFIVEPGNGLIFRWGPGRSDLKLARERQLVVELAARIVHGNPNLTLYIIHYDSNGLRLRQSVLRHARDRFHGSLTLGRDVASYTLAIRMAGRGIVEFGEFHTLLDSFDRISFGGVPPAIAGSTPAIRVPGRYLVARVADTISNLDRRNLAKGVDLARHRARRLRSKVTAFAQTARRGARAAEKADGSDVAFAGARNRSQLELRKLNDDLALNGKSDTAAWLTEALKFAVSVDCYESAERLARHALAIWPQFDARERNKVLVPLVETLASVGDVESSRSLLEENASAVLSDDKLATYARLLGIAHVQHLVDFMLPSGKLDAFSLSRAKPDRIGAYYEAKKHQFGSDPQSNLLLCNAQLERSEALYCKYLNKCLAPHDVGQVSSVAFGSNVLQNIEFGRGSPVPGGPCVSVIMAARNAAGTVDYAIRSILRQEHRNIEFLICDDASNDGTLAAIKREAGKDERVRIFRSEKRQGRFNIRNALLGLAQGEYAAFHDANDYALPSRIRLQVGVLVALQPRAVIARSVRVRPTGAFVFSVDQSALHDSPVTIMATKKTLKLQASYGAARFASDTKLIEQIRDSEGDKSIHRMKHPLLLSLWKDNSLTTNPKVELFEDDHCGPAERRAMELTARQRLMGSKIVPEFEVVAALAATENVLELSTIAAVERS
jgi:hypothetical protein